MPPRRCRPPACRYSPSCFQFLRTNQISERRVSALALLWIAVSVSAFAKPAPIPGGSGISFPNPSSPVEFAGARLRNSVGRCVVSNKKAILSWRFSAPLATDSTEGGCSCGESRYEEVRHCCTSFFSLDYGSHHSQRFGHYAVG